MQVGRDNMERKHHYTCRCNDCVRQRNARRRRLEDQDAERGTPRPPHSTLYEVMGDHRVIYDDTVPSPPSRQAPATRVRRGANSAASTGATSPPISMVGTSSTGAKQLSPPTTPKTARRAHAISVLIILALLVSGGILYGVVLYMEPGAEIPTVPAIVALPSPTPMPTPTPTPQPTAMPTSAASPTALSTPTVTAAPTPSATLAPTLIPTPSGPTEQEMVVNAFAECNGKYSGEERRRRVVATNSAIDRKLHSIASIRALVEQNCGGVFPGLTVADSRPAATEPPKPTLMPSPAPTLRPTLVVPTPNPIPASSAAVREDRRFNRETLETMVHQLINEYRDEQGRAVFQWDEDLAALARAHSLDMAKHDYYRHVNQAGDDPTARARKAGYDCRNPLSIGVAENIYLLYGHTSSMRLGDSVTYQWISQEDLARRFVAGWIASTGHQRNILDGRYTRTGIGVAFGTASGIPHGVYITQQFC